MDRSTRLWKVWWVYGVPVAAISAALLFFAEELRLAYRPAWADLLDVARLATFWFWCWLAWACARNVRLRVWTPVARLALAAGLVVTVHI